MRVTRRRNLKEGQLTMSQARQMANRNGIGFSANSEAGLKQGLILMQKQLADMEAHPNRYIQALESGFVIAGFGGDLPGGVEVPETLMTGEVPPGMTAKEAFQQVVDYMHQVIDECKRAALPGKKAALPKGPSAAIEDKTSDIKIAEAKLRKAKRELKALRESEVFESEPSAGFVKVEDQEIFDALVDEMVEGSYTFEDVEGAYIEVNKDYLDTWNLAKELGYPILSLKTIMETEPDAKFIFAWGTPVRVSLEDAKSYISEMGFDVNDVYNTYYGVGIDDFESDELF